MNNNAKQLYHKDKEEYKSFFPIVRLEDIVRVVPTLCMVDRVNGFNVAEETPCSLYSDTIKVAGDMIHPNYNGFFQFADAMLGYEYELLGL